MPNRTSQSLLPIALNDCRLPIRQRPTALLPSRVLTAPGGIEAPEEVELDHLAALVPHPLLRLLPIDDDHVVAFIPSLTGAAVLNGAAVALLQQLPLANPQAIRNEAGLIAALNRLGLLTATPQAGLEPPPRSEVLVAWLHVTNTCNLGCTYCYIEKSAEKMAIATGLQAVDALIQSALTHGYREIALKYAGGEPLLALDVVEALHGYAQARTQAAGIDMQASVLTNGAALSASAVARLQALGVGVTVSLDGLDLTNDAQRPLRNGRPSAQRIRAGIMRAVEAGCTPTVAVTVTAASVAALPELASWLLSRNIPFSVSFARDIACGTGTTEHFIGEADAIIAGMRALYRTIEEQPPRWSVLGTLLDRSDLSQPHSHACAAGEDYLVIDHHGRVAKCQMTIAQPVSTIHAADPLLDVRRDPRGLQHIAVDARQECSSCEWRYWCGGGCPIATFRATGRYDVKSPNCEIYKALYPDLLRLEGRRLLHWEGGV